MSDLDDTVSLLVTELVSNGVRHAQTQLELVLTLDGRCLRIAVTDGDPTPPRPHLPVSSGPDLRVGGWGLALVDSLASEWGTDIDDARGKTVWVEIDTSVREHSVRR